MENNLDKTMQFDLNINKEDLTKSILNDVYTALKEKGYKPNKPIGRISDFRDPSYITSYNGARALLRKLERDEILEEVIKSYLDIK